MITKSELDLVILKKDFPDRPSREQIDHFINLALNIILEWQPKKNVNVCRIEFQHFINISWSSFVGWYAPTLQMRLQELGIKSHLSYEDSPYVYVTAYDLMHAVENYDQKKNLL